MKPTERAFYKNTYDVEFGSNFDADIEVFELPIKSVKSVSIKKTCGRST